MRLIAPWCRFYKKYLTNAYADHGDINVSVLVVLYTYFYVYFNRTCVMSLIQVTRVCSSLSAVLFCEDSLSARALLVYIAYSCLCNIHWLNKFKMAALWKILGIHIMDKRINENTRAAFNLTRHNCTKSAGETTETAGTCNYHSKCNSGEEKRKIMR